MKKIPQRTCVKCREKVDKNKLFRIVKNKEGEIFYDPSGKANGRGAYVCGKEECIESIEKGSLLNKVFGVDVDAQLKQKLKETIMVSKIRMEELNRKN